MLDLHCQLVTLKAQQDDCWRANQRAFCCQEDVQRIRTSAQCKASASEARWERAKLRYQQLEVRLETLQTKLRNATQG